MPKYVVIATNDLSVYLTPSMQTHDTSNFPYMEIFKVRIKLTISRPPTVQFLIVRTMQTQRVTSDQKLEPGKAWNYAN